MDINKEDFFSRYGWKNRSMGGNVRAGPSLLFSDISQNDNIDRRYRLTSRARRKRVNQACAGARVTCLDRFSADPPCRLRKGCKRVFREKSIGNLANTLFKRILNVGDHANVEQFLFIDYEIFMRAKTERDAAGGNASIGILASFNVASIQYCVGL